MIYSSKLEQSAMIDYIYINSYEILTEYITLSLIGDHNINS